jgi:hypothetical protein
VSDSEEHLAPWQAILYGFFMLVVGVGLFLLLSGMESSGQGGRAHWLVALLYYIGGKWTVAGLFGLAALVLFVVAYRAYMQGEE